MKSWKEVPHLFMGGKFKVLIEYSDLEIKLSASDWNYISNRAPFKLIARPISDMSDKEIAVRMNVSAPLDYGFCEAVKTGLTDSIKRKELTFGAFEYLLSIGVYPFDQDKPKDVIWRYENKKENTK